MFDLLVLGCGGGPIETNLTSFLIKPSSSSWHHGSLALDAGSSLGAVVSLLATVPQAFYDFHFDSSDPVWNAGRVLDSLTSYCITHGHLDHVSGLVISTQIAASTKPIYASDSTINVLSRVFDGYLWPNLADWPDRSPTSYEYHSISLEAEPFQPCPGIQAIAFPLSHGQNHEGCYESTAFIFSTPTNDLLIFGDVEPDSLSGKPYNRAIWESAALRIKQSRLSTVVIECSYTNARPSELLYGHLNPYYLYEELCVLASFLGPNSSTSSLKGRLNGLKVCITHIKDSVYSGESLSASTEQSSSSSSSPSPPSRVIDIHPTSTGQPAPTVLNSSPTYDGDGTISNSPPHISSSPSTSPSRHKFTTDTKSPFLKKRLRSVPTRPVDIIRQELHDLELQHGLGVTFIFLEQGMRLTV